MAYITVTTTPQLFAELIGKTPIERNSGTILFYGQLFNDSLPSVRWVRSLTAPETDEPSYRIPSDSMVPFVAYGDTHPEGATWIWCETDTVKLVHSVGIPGRG